MSAAAVSSPTRKFTPAPKRAPKDEGADAPASAGGGNGGGGGTDAPAAPESGRQAREGARDVIKAAQKPRTDAVRDSSAEERRDDNRAGERDENVAPEATLANQDPNGQDGASVRPRQRGEDRSEPERPEDEDGTSLDAHAVNRARAAARDGKLDKDAFRDYLRGEGERADDGPEAGTAFSPTTLAHVSEALHQDSLVLRDGRRDTVEAVERGDEVPVDDRVEALVGARQERATLEAEAATLEELEANEEFTDGLEHGPSRGATGVEAIDGDGEVESDDGEVTPIVGLTQSDIDARQDAIEAEIAAADAEIELLATSFTAEEEAALRDVADADEGLQLGAAADGDEPALLDDEVVDAALEDVELAEDAQQPAPAEGADAAPEAPAPPNDQQLLDQAAADGVIDPNARDQFAFNEAGELTYAAQPGDGYWQAAEHVAPPAGQDFATHWRNTWTENSMRNHGVPDEQFVGVGQPVVIPGYTRDQFIAAYAPPPVDPATEGDPAGAPTDASDAPDAADGPHETAPTSALPAEPGDIPVDVAQGPTQSGGPLLVVGDTTVEVAPEDFVFDGVPTTTYTAQVPVSSEQYGDFTATIRRTGLPDQGAFTYEVVEAVPSGGGAAPTGDDVDAGDDPGGEPSVEQPPAEQPPAEQPPAGPVDYDATVMAGEHEVYAHGGDAVSTSGGGLNVYSDGVQLAHVFDDGRVELAEGVTDADLQAFLGTQLLHEQDEDGSPVFGYVVGDGAEVIEDPNHVEGYEILVDHYAEQQPQD